jgi:hypothetical protein
LFSRAAVPAAPGWLTPATTAVDPMHRTATWQTSVADLGAACDQSNESRKFNKVRRAERLTRLARLDRFTLLGNGAVLLAGTRARKAPGWGKSGC